MASENRSTSNEFHYVIPTIEVFLAKSHVRVGILRSLFKNKDLEFMLDAMQNQINQLPVLIEIFRTSTPGERYLEALNALVACIRHKLQFIFQMVSVLKNEDTPASAIKWLEPYADFELYKTMLSSNKIYIQFEENVDADISRVIVKHKHSWGNSAENINT